MEFIEKKTYYRQTTHEFNLPAWHTCPFSDYCKIVVDRKTGKFDITGKWYKCYAAIAERFPWVRKSRWGNLRSILKWDEIIIPKWATHIRIHASWDFFNQKYFDQWLEVTKKNPKIRFRAFTKSIKYRVNRLSDIPENFVLTASYGSKQDYLIWEYWLKFAMVFRTKKKAEQYWLPIDTDDRYAQQWKESFALVDNFSKQK